MSLRQGGLLAQRLLLQTGCNQNASGSKLLWNAAMFSSKAGADASSPEVASVLSAPKLMSIPQYSPAAAAALADKAPGFNGSLLKASKMFSMSRAVAPAAPAAIASELAAPAAAAPKDRASTLKNAIKAAAVAAVGLAVMASPALADAPEPWQLLFQDSATSTMQAMVDLHHDICFFLITIVSVTLYMFGQILTKFHYSRVLKPEKLTHHTTAEVIWTVIPTITVLMIAVPSLTLIYSLDQHTERPGLTVKIIGRQWYWSYEMHDHLQHKLLDPDRLVDLAARSLDK